MKWYKHFSDSLDDPFIQELMDKFSHFGYVAYFGLLEIISKENGVKLTGKLDISPTYLRRKLRSSLTKLRQVFDFCQTFGKLSVTFSEKEWKFFVPKLLDLKDNYSKDLQVTGKKPSNHKEVEEEVYKKEVDKKERKTLKENTKRKVDIPDWLPLEAWQGFIEMRKSIKKPLTDRAIKLCFEKLWKLKEKGHEPEEVLNQSTFSSWQGLFPIKQDLKNNTNKFLNFDEWERKRKAGEYDRE